MCDDDDLTVQDGLKGYMGGADVYRKQLGRGEGLKHGRSFVGADLLLMLLGAISPSLSSASSPEKPAGWAILCFFDLAEVA